MSVIFEKLGIFGLKDTIENAVLTSLYLGDPCLLIGAPGTAKTEAIEMLGSAVREHTRKEFPGDTSKEFKYHIYDASKLNFEDLIGLINPEKMKEGKIEFIETPTTIWGKTMACFDEFNRIDPDRQSNLFELLRSRNCMGHSTGVKFIFNAMNPYGDTGTNILSDALVDRHMFFVEFPSFNTMDSAVRSLIINRIGRSDGAGMRMWNGKEYKFDVKNGVINEHLASVGKEIWTILKKTAEVYTILDQEIGPKVTLLLDKCLQSIESSVGSKTTERHFLFSGRRAGLLRRGIIAYRALAIAKSQVLSGYEIPTLYDSIVNSFMLGMPFGISGSDEPAQVEATKAKANSDVMFMWKTLDESGFNGIDTLYELFTSQSLLRKMELLLSTDVLENSAKQQAWNEMIFEDQKGNNVINNILSIMCAINENIVPVNTRAILKNTIPIATSSGQQKIVLKTHLSPHATLIQAIIKENQDNPLTNYFVVTALDKLNLTTDKSESFVIEELKTISRAAGLISNKVKVMLDAASSNTVKVTNGTSKLSSSSTPVADGSYL